MASSLQQQPQPRRKMEHRLPHRTSRAEGSRLTTTTQYSGTSVKMNEKEMLHGLNDRFAGFIEKVRRLEHQNHLLESEIQEAKERRALMAPSSLEEEHGAELGELRKLLREITRQKHQVEMEHQNLEEELSHLRTRYEKEAHGRSDAESGVAMLKKDIGDAYQAKLQLDKKAQSLVDEIDFLKKSHEAEVSRMIAQVEEAQQVNVGAAQSVDFGKADLTAALREIRAQLEGHAASDLQQADETFRAQFAKLTEAAESKREALKASQQEIQGCRRRLQAKSVELDCNKGTRDALERQLRDVEDRHHEDIFHYQDTIKELENELISAKFDISAHLREYQDLLNVKMELDVEILSYRKLLEGEETHMSTVSGTPVSMPYIYRQSPVYTLPCLGRQSGPGRRAEPQYKFVEEIITETTREIEMSEFEETGSEETVDGGAEEGCDKAESEEEAEDNQSDKYAPDQDGEQASDSQQNPVESAERSEQGDDDKVEEGSSVEEGGSETVDKTEAESRGPDAAESAENNDRPAAESAHSEEVRSTEAIGMPENEPRDSVANVSGQRGSNAAQTVQKDVAAKAGDSKIEESEEVKMTESEVDKKVSSLKGSEESDVKDTIDTAQAKLLKDESSAKGPTDSDNVQESSMVGKLQGEAPSLPTETMEKITDLTAALSVPLPKDTVQPEKQNKENPSVVPKGEEKEDRITESMALNKAVKSDIGHEVPKSIENTTDDADKEKDKSPSVKSETPKLEDEKPNTGDDTQTVDATFTQGKIAVTAETKDPQQGESDSSKTKEPTNAIDDTDLEKDKLTAAKSDVTEPPKLDGEKSISGDKTILPKEKIAVTAETKDPQQGAPDNSKTQKPSNGKLQDEKPDSWAKKQTVEPISPKENIALTEQSKDSQQGEPDSSKTQEPSNAIDDTDLEKDKCTAAKSDLTEPPKLKGEKSISGDNTQTVEPIFPKEKTAVTVENKDAKQPESKSQELSKVPEKLNNAKEKEEKLKDSAKTNDSGKATENKTETIEISETKTPSQKEPGISAVSLTSKTADGLMSEAVKPKTETGSSNGIGGIKAGDNEPIKVVQHGEAGKEKTNTSI